MCETKGKLVGEDDVEEEEEEGTSSGAGSVNTTTDGTGTNAATTLVSNFISILFLILLADY